jgi:hypothetical protein
LIAPILMLTVGGTLAVVLSRPSWLLPATLTVVVGGSLAWLVVGAFWPGGADRGCPKCGEEALERLDPKTTLGQRCGACGHVDPLASSWFLAEEEDGSLEEVVLRQRGRTVHTDSK